VKQADLFGGPQEPPKPQRSEPAKPQPPPPQPPPKPAAAQPAPPQPPPQAPKPAAAAPPTQQQQQQQQQAPKVRVGNRVLTVSELTRQLKETVEPAFGRVIVRGEVTGFKGPNPRGHLYFALKDEFAWLDTRIWQSTAQRMKFALKDGMEVLAEGSIDIYAPQGRYAFIVQKIEPAGMGALALAYEQLKQKLLAEGLFGEKRKKPKRPLPVLPRRIGVVTSVTGAALRDFLKVLYRRHPRLSVLVSDARVQGDGASIEIARGIRKLSRTNVDVIVVTRGGGSAEDLWAFNEEIVARAIFDSPVPVVSAVGHEVDVTLADFVADHRAATPSAAAEALAPVLAELELKLAQQRQRLARAVERSVVGHRARLEKGLTRLGDPRRRISQSRLRFADLGDRVVAAIRKSHRTRSAALEALEKRIARARPQARLLEVRQRLSGLKLKLNSSGHALTRRERAHLQRLKAELWQHTPKPKLLNERRRIAREKDRLPQLIKGKLERHRERLHALERRLEGLSPLKVLARGYSIAKTADGHVITSVDQAPPGTQIRVTLQGEQELDATVTGARKSNGT
jgi:exodeoxyribonuclease VII large subunit